LYFGLMSWAEGLQAARALFWADRWIVIPILMGFGLQAALYAILKFRLFLPVAVSGPSGALMGASGTTSAVAMVACCAHHVTDVLPLLGLTAATAFLGQYRTAFLFVGLGTTLLGILVMAAILFRERRRVTRLISQPYTVESP